MRKDLSLLLLIFIVNYCKGQNNWNLTGNSGTVAGTNFLGTTDANDFVIKTNSTERLRISLKGRVLTNGSNSSLFMGSNAGNETNTGIDNIGLGMLPLSANTSGYDNIAIGSYSLRFNSIGRDNIGVGVASLNINTSGIRNVSIGSLSSFKNTTGNDNTSAGTLSLYNNSSGSGNTAFGYYSLSVNTTGSNNSVFGYGADVSTNNLTNASAFGYNAKVSSSNSLVLGGTGTDIVKVGIGVTAPNARLEINSAISGVSGLRFTQLNNSSAINPSNGKLLSLNPNGDVILVEENAADGSETKLSAGANMTITGTGTFSNPYQISANGNFYWNNSTLGGGSIINNNAGAVIIGNITSIPGSYKLYVSGGILTEKIKVSLKSSANWADFVFKNGYRLRSLSDLDRYIKEYKHLPGIPSSDELLNKGGIDVSEMLAKQMEKIEELTLYIIEINKQCDLLKKQLNDLKRIK